MYEKDRKYIGHHKNYIENHKNYIGNQNNYAGHHRNYVGNHKNYIGNHEGCAKTVRVKYTHGRIYRLRIEHHPIPLVTTHTLPPLPRFLRSHFGTSAVALKPGIRIPAKRPSPPALPTHTPAQWGIAQDASSHHQSFSKSCTRTQPQHKHQRSHRIQRFKARSPCTRSSSRASWL